LAFGSPHDEGQAVDIDHQLLDMLLVFGIFGPLQLGDHP